MNAPSRSGTYRRGQCARAVSTGYGPLYVAPPDCAIENVTLTSFEANDCSASRTRDGACMAPVHDNPGRSIQEMYYPELTCFGCGHANDRGLRLQSYEVDGVVFATFVPWPEHDNGSGYLNGGIISTVLDCHATAAVQLEAHRQGWHPATGSGLSFVTAGLEVRFLRPTPLREPVELTADLLAVAEPEMTAVSHIIAGG